MIESRGKYTRLGLLAPTNKSFVNLFLECNMTQGKDPKRIRAIAG